MLLSEFFKSATSGKSQYYNDGGKSTTICGHELSAVVVRGRSTNYRVAQEVV